jgi:sugar lactone lactonase YvrE
MDRLNLLVDGIACPEGPRWQDSRLWFSDIGSRQVLTVDTAGRPTIVANLHDNPSGLGFLPDGRLVVALMGSRTIHTITGGASTLYADLSDYPADYANDMVVERDGRVYVGLRRWTAKQSADQGDPINELLVVVEPDGASHIEVGDVIAPNGAIITDDGQTLILAETYAHRLTAFDRGEHGELSNRRVFAPTTDMTPDGICLDLDAQGCVWFASPFTQQVVRMRAGGEVADRIPIRSGWPFACVRGGIERNILYILVAHTSSRGIAQMLELQGPGSDEHRKKAMQYSKGSIWITEVAIPGAGTP